MNTQQSPQSLITALLTKHLQDIDTGDKPNDLNTVLKIKSALDADRPTVDLILTTILNEYTFLNKEYGAQSDEEFQAIMKFLGSFYQHVQKEFLGKVATYKAGVSMLQGSLG
jgi:hypothetical protein